MSPGSTKVERTREKMAENTSFLTHFLQSPENRERMNKPSIYFRGSNFVLFNKSANKAFLKPVLANRDFYLHTLCAILLCSRILIRNCCFQTPQLLHIKMKNCWPHFPLRPYKVVKPGVTYHSLSRVYFSPLLYPKRFKSIICYNGIDFAWLLLNLFFFFLRKKEKSHLF